MRKLNGVIIDKIAPDDPEVLWVNPEHSKNNPSKIVMSICEAGKWRGISDNEAIKKSYSELLSDRENSKLVPGQWYRITDYVATTVDTESRSVGHQFDILIMAISKNDLSEEGFACRHDGDTYFQNVNFNAWKVWYCIDNDTSRFSWADEVNGKGVIYRLIDEFDNDIPYDFKSIQFKRYKVTAQTTYQNSLGQLNGEYIGLGGNRSRGFNIDSSDYKWFYTFSKLGETWEDNIEDFTILTDYLVEYNKIEPCVVNYDTEIRELNNFTISYGKLLDNIRKRLDSSTSAFLNCTKIAWHNTFGNDLSNVSILGTFDAISASTYFRNNIIIAHMMDVSFDKEGRDNTIICSKSKFDFCEISNGFYRNIIFTKNITLISTNSVFADNYLIFENTFSGNNFRGVFQKNTINVSDFIYNDFYYFVENNINSVFNQNIVKHKIRYCNFNSQVTDCTFCGMLYYINIGENETQKFKSNIIKGVIVGQQNSRILLDSQYFYIPNDTNICRCVEIEGDSNGNIVASWWNSGVRKVITKAIADESWTEL